MNDEEKNVGEALSNFFDSDFLEVNIKEDNENAVKEELIKNDNVIESEVMYNNIKEIDNKIDNVPTMSSNYFDKNDFIKNNDIEFNNNFNDKYQKKENDVSSEEKDNNDLNIKNTNYKKILLCFLVGFIIGGIIILLIVNYVSNVERKTNCSFEAKDKNFKNTDEYTITYKGNKITYVEGIYIYTALADDFKPQIEYIKEEKIPVIINSNGMPGFTHMYEISDDNIKVFSYYDVMLFDFNVVDKNDDNSMPLSYINLKSDVTYKKLVELLEKKGYKCTQSK